MSRPVGGPSLHVTTATNSGKANYETMTSTGYQPVVFTEINPTSTTTTIVGIYTHLYGEFTIQFTFGPFTVVSHLGQETQTVTTTAPQTAAPTTTTSPPTVTAVVTVTQQSSSSTSFSSLNCEYLLAVSLWAVSWLSLVLVSYMPTSCIYTLTILECSFNLNVNIRPCNCVFNTLRKTKWVRKCNARYG